MYVCMYYIYMCVCVQFPDASPVVPILPSPLPRQDLDFDTMPLVALSDKPQAGSMAGTIRGFNVFQERKREKKGCFFAEEKDAYFWREKKVVVFFR